MLCSKQLLKLTNQNHLKHVRNFSFHGYWTFLAHSAPVASVQSGLIYAHNVWGTGNWPLDIIAGAIIFRNFISLPFGTIQRTIMTQHSVVVKGKMDLLAYRLNEAVKNKEMSQEEAKTLGTREARHLISIRRWFDPEYRTFWKVGPLFASEILIWLCYTFSLRITVAGVPTMAAKFASLEMRDQSIGWIEDLTLSDPYSILPLITCAATLASLRVSNKATFQHQILIPCIDALPLTPSRSAVHERVAKTKRNTRRRIAQGHQFFSPTSTSVHVHLCLHISCCKSSPEQPR